MLRLRLALVSLSSAALVAGLAIVACSSFDDATPGGADAAGDGPASAGDAADAGDQPPIADGGTDATADGEAPPACDPTKPFGPPTLVQGNINTMTGSDDGFWILQDGMTAYLSSDRPDSGSLAYRIFSARRPDVSAPWGAVSPELAVDDAGAARFPVVSPDGLTLYYARGVGGPSQVWVAKRSSVSVPFGPPVLAASPVNDSTANTVTWVAANGASIMLSSNRGTNDVDVYRVGVLSDGGFGTPSAIAALSSLGEDYAILTPDELQAFVSSSRAGTKGGLDLYYTRRTSKALEFPPPQPLDDLNTTFTEAASYVSADGCTLYFRRTTSFSVYKILVAKRPK